jgi:hypothetical protein
MKRQLINIVLLCMLLIQFSSCRKEEDKNQNTKSGVLIVNEGNFGWGNASLSAYDRENKSLTKDIFKDNNSFQIGDVAQSALVYDTLILVAVNNSSKVEVISKNTFRRIISITIPNSSPRYIQPLNNNEALVTELYAKKIWLINFRTGTIVRSIDVSGETNQMILSGNKLFITERTKFNGSFVAQIRVIDLSNYSTAKIIPLQTEPNSIAMDNSGNIWTLTDEKATESKTSMLVKINSSSLSAIDSISFPSGNAPRNLAYLKSNNSLIYSIAGNIFKYTIGNATLDAVPFIQTNSTSLYTLGVDNTNNEIYTSDALDYVQSSRILRYNASAQKLDEFTAGIISTNFLFY